MYPKLGQLLDWGKKLLIKQISKAKAKINLNGIFDIKLKRHSQLIYINLIQLCKNDFTILSLLL